MEQDMEGDNERDNERDNKVLAIKGGTEGEIEEEPELPDPGPHA